MKEKFRVLIILYASLLAGIIIFAFFTGSIDWNTILEISKAEMPYLLLPVVAIGLSEILYKNNMKQLETKSSVDERTAVYQSASVVRWAILEGSALVVIVLPNIPRINVLVIVAFYLIIFPRYWKFQQIVSPI